MKLKSTFITVLVFTCHFLSMGQTLIKGTPGSGQSASLLADDANNYTSTTGNFAIGYSSTSGLNTPFAVAGLSTSFNQTSDPISIFVGIGSSHNASLWSNFTTPPGNELRDMLKVVSWLSLFSARTEFTVKNNGQIGIGVNPTLWNGHVTIQTTNRQHWN